MKTKLVNPASLSSLAGIVLSVGVLFAWNSSFASDVASSLKPILGETFTETSTTVDELHHFYLSDSVLLIKKGNGYDENSSIEILDSRTLEKKWDYKGPCHFYHLSVGGEKVIVISQILHEGIAKIEAFDITGNKLFVKNNFSGYLLPSPNGKYFHSQYSLVKYNKFYVFDRNGNELFSRDRPLRYEWLAAAFNDTIVAYCTGESIDFIGVPDGNLINSISREKDKYNSYPGAVLAANSDHMVFFWYKNLIHIGADLKVNWQHSNFSPFLNGAFSEDGEYFAVYYGSMPNFSLSLLETATGNTLWDQPVAAKVPDWNTPYPGVFFSNSFITILNPQSSFWAKGELKTDAQTFIFSFDKKTGAFVQKSIVPGITIVNETNGQVVTFSTIANERKTIRVKEWDGALPYK